MRATQSPGATEPHRVVLVVGQGYVGLTLSMRAVEVGEDVIGVHIDTPKIESLRRGLSHVADIADLDVERARPGRYRPVAAIGDVAGFDRGDHGSDTAH